MEKSARESGMVVGNDNGDAAPKNRRDSTRRDKAATTNGIKPRIQPPPMPGAENSATERIGESNLQNVMPSQSVSGLSTQITQPKPRATTISQPIEDPFPFHFDLRIPKDINEMQLEIIKTTARYVAKNGMQFLGAIAGKHAANPLFDFTKLSHQHFSFFNKLVEVYKKLMMPSKKMMNDLKFMADANNRMKLLDRMHEKAEWDMIQMEKRRRERERRKEEQEAMNTVDWQDFVVVATVDFDPEETHQLIVENDEDLEYKAQVALAQESDEHPQVIAASSTIHDAIDKSKVDRAETSLKAQDAEQKSEDQQNYVQIGSKRVPIRKGVARRSSHPDAERPSEVKYVKDELTGKLILVDEVKQHMRVSLINPQWQEQKKKELEKFQTTNLASNTEMAESLMNLASARSDIIMQEDGTDADGMETREPRRKRAKR